mmetsp:Transcript_36467/g.104896  ORF Transcript_36467/g.104896 Transcript_36467/m.104896 type:complete len:398 (-) Transcript_36467:1739-2932(-)
MPRIRPSVHARACARARANGTLDEDMHGAAAIELSPLRRLRPGLVHRGRRQQVLPRFGVADGGAVVGAGLVSHACRDELPKPRPSIVALLVALVRMQERPVVLDALSKRRDGFGLRPEALAQVGKTHVFGRRRSFAEQFRDACPHQIQQLPLVAPLQHSLKSPLVLRLHVQPHQVFPQDVCIVRQRSRGQLIVGPSLARAFRVVVQVPGHVVLDQAVLWKALQRELSQGLSNFRPLQTMQPHRSGLGEPRSTSVALLRGTPVHVVRPCRGLCKRLGDHRGSRRLTSSRVLQTEHRIAPVREEQLEAARAHMQLQAQLVLGLVLALDAILPPVIQRVWGEKASGVLEDDHLGGQTKHGLGKRLLCAAMVQLVGTLHALPEIFGFELRMDDHGVAHKGP